MPKFSILLSFVILSFFTSCKGQGEVNDSLYNLMLETLLEHNVKEISIENAYQIRNNVTFLDAREQKEYSTSHINNAFWVGYDALNLNSIKSIDKNAPIIVYCSVGYRSEKVTQKLLALGYKNVSNLYGGIFEWVNQGYPVYNSFGLTKKIHAYDKTWSKWLKKGEKVY